VAKNRSSEKLKKSKKWKYGIFTESGIPYFEFIGKTDVQGLKKSKMEL